MTEPFTGTVRFIGLRASFAKAKELLGAVLVQTDEEEISPGLREEIEAFLAQFEDDDA